MADASSDGLAVEGVSPIAHSLNLGEDALDADAVDGEEPSRSAPQAMAVSEGPVGENLAEGSPEWASTD